MNQLLSTLIILSSFSAIAETKPYISNDTLYYSDDLTFYEGQTIYMGEGHNDKWRSFASIFFSPASRSIDEIEYRIHASAKYNRSTPTIKGFYKHKNAYYLKLEGKGINNYYCDIDVAIEAGEIALTPNIPTIGKGQYGYPFERNDSLFFNSEIVLTPGQLLTIGTGIKPNGDFEYISIENGVGNEMTGRKLQLERFKLSGLKSAGLKYYIFLKGDNKIYRCNLENAIYSGELLINGKNYKRLNIFNKADELKKLKELHDNGTLTEEEFQLEKRKILDK